MAQMIHFCFLNCPSCALGPLSGNPLREPLLLGSCWTSGNPFIWAFVGNFVLVDIIKGILEKLRRIILLRRYVLCQRALVNNEFTARSYNGFLQRVLLIDVVIGKGRPTCSNLESAQYASFSGFRMLRVDANILQYGILNMSTSKA